MMAESEKITKQSHLGCRCWRALLLEPTLTLLVVSSVSRPCPSAGLIRLVLRIPLFLPLLGRFASRILSKGKIISGWLESKFESQLCRLIVMVLAALLAIPAGT